MNLLKFVRKPDVAWQKLEDNIVVVTPKTKKIHIIEGAGICIWKALEEPKSKDVLTEMVCSEFEISFDTAAKDLDIFLQDLLSKEIIELKK